MSLFITVGWFLLFVVADYCCLLLLVVVSLLITVGWWVDVVDAGCMVIVSWLLFLLWGEVAYLIVCYCCC